MMRIDRKLVYFVLGCLIFIFTVVGATYAYFTASAEDAETVYGESEAITFGLGVERVTSIDMAFGLIPMKNNQAPYAAEHMCRDALGNAGCQIYKIVVRTNSDMVMFLDGYIETFRKEGVETRFSEVFYDKEADTFYTEYTAENFLEPGFIEDNYISTGVRGSDPAVSLNHTDDLGCLFIKNEQIGGSEEANERIFYVMIWVYDNGEPQDYLQGMQMAYTGKVTFQTAEGNEISATFE